MTQEWAKSYRPPRRCAPPPRSAACDQSPLSSSNLPRAVGHQVLQELFFSRGPFRPVYYYAQISGYSQVES